MGAEGLHNRAVLYATPKRAQINIQNCKVYVVLSDYHGGVLIDDQALGLNVHGVALDAGVD